MPKFKVVDAHSTEQLIEADCVEDAAAQIERNNKRNIYGVECGSRSWFYIDRGEGGPLYPIGVSAAAVELGIGGFEP